MRLFVTGLGIVVLFNIILAFVVHACFQLVTSSSCDWVQWSVYARTSTSCSYYKLEPNYIHLPLPAYCSRQFFVHD